MKKINKTWAWPLLAIAGLLWCGALLWGHKPVWIRPSFDQPYIDIGQWVENGIYKRQPEEGHTGLAFSDISVIRVQPLPVDEADDSVLRMWVAHALSQKNRLTPAISSTLQQLKLSKRTFYVVSGFAGVDEPRDLYEMFVSIEGERYYLTLFREGVSGQWRAPGNVFQISARSAENLIRRFEALEAADGAR